MTEPRILFCAEKSGSGKTTVVCSVLQALVDRGANPVAFKCGPDYIDPMFHSEVIGAPSRNLDLFFLGEEKTKYLLKQNAKGALVSVIEGAMGYYDGVAMSSDASAYDLARKTQTPAVLIVDARGCALSLCARIKGFTQFRADSWVKGVILNRTSAMMYPRLKEIIEAECSVRVYGFMPECAEAALESRHLGLVTAQEVENLKEKLHFLARKCEEHVELDALLELANTAPELPTYEIALPEPLDKPVKIAVARDKAFCFYYADALGLLEKLGAQLCFFSPLEDDRLPEGVNGLYLGGGYPELYAKKLSENIKMRGSVKSAIGLGLPTIAECGGFLYLHDSLEDADGTHYPMAGIINARGYKTDRLSRFGYITLTAKSDGMMMKKGESIPAHEFHYWDSSSAGGAFDAQKPQSKRRWDCSYNTKTMYAGFAHFHLWSEPVTAKRFVDACDKYRRSENGTR